MTISNASSTGFTWTKSTYSGGQSDCVEVAHGALSAALPVRDSKRTDGPAVVFGGDAWAGFVAGVKRGDVA
ncbi:DUF397 domain-containing protein [Streptomyces cinerochromogenes]|uniref:DUF397 domain-containing protein n=1 Tax=Streptomyces cinerochromogenes TaxID=66422 RepID=A0ABW7BF82_9ACTN